MSGQTIVVTGSAVGIGRGVCEAFAEPGATIIALDVDDAENAITRESVEQAGARCLTFHCDIGDRYAVKTVFDNLPDDVTTIDLLLNNAAVYGDTKLLSGDYDTQTAAFENGMSTCANGAFNCTKAAVPFLENSNNPNVINVITDHVHPDHDLMGGMATAYDCAKFSLWRLNQNWAIELKDKGIRVNGLCFGATDTPMLEKFAPQALGKGMFVGDLVTAVRNVIDQGADGSTGQSYEFGMGPTPREESLQQIEAIKNG